MCVLCWDELAIEWHPDAGIGYSFAMTFKKMLIAFGYHPR
jgi:hypothetical protein